MVSCGTADIKRTRGIPGRGFPARESDGVKHHKHLGQSILLVLIFFLAAWLGSTAVWAFTNWNTLTIEEIVFELTQPLTGTGNNIIGKYFLKCVAPAAAGSIVLVVLEITAFHSPVYDIIRTGVFAVSCGMLTGSLIYAWIYLDVGGFVENHGKDSSYIEDHYVNPEDVSITFPDRKRNLIYIYLESMEVTDSGVTDGGGFAQDYIPELTALAKENEDFSGSSRRLNGGVSLFGTTWTVGAMFAETAGLPLKIPLDSNGMSTQAQFFPGIVTLGDILEQAGYTQELMMGSKADFGGKEHYFTQHGSYRMADYNYAVANGFIPRGYDVWWGYEDEKLFSFAKYELTQLAAAGEPFNFTLLTADTHFPDGYVCDLCDDEFDSQYANVYRCSSRQTAEFIHWILQQDFYENTTIILSGDHPTMDADFTESVDRDYERKVYTCYIHSAAEPADPERSRQYSTLDDFPTTLAALGCTIEGDRLGMGTNLFSDRDTLLESDGEEAINTELTRNSPFMNAASGVSRDAVKVRDEIGSLKPKTKIRRNGAEYLRFTVEGLEQLADYDDEVIYVYFQIRNTDQLILTSPKLVRQLDGTYVVDVPIRNLDGNTEFTYMLRVFTRAGTIDLTDAKSCSMDS